MIRRATPLIVLFVLLALGSAQAQTAVTVRQINAVAQDVIDQLKAAGTNQTLGDIDTAIQSAFTDSTVTITVVIMTDPFMSGLRSVDSPGTPDAKIPRHMFVRDVAVATDGKEGMGIQVFSEEPATTGLLDVTVGDVVQMTGTVGYFSGGLIQFEVSSLTVLGRFDDQGLTEADLDPVTVTTSDINAPIAVNGGSEVQINWDNFASLSGQLVRIENVKVLVRALNDTRFPGMMASSDNGDSYIQLDFRYSTRYNNEVINTYSDFPEMLTRESGDPFRPPAVGSTANLEGYVIYESSSFEFSTFGAEPNGAWMQLLPFLDTDIEVVAEPSVTNIALTPPDFVPGDAPVPIIVDVTAQDGVIAEVTANYEASTGESGSVVLADASGKALDGTFGGDIPALPDGAFVNYRVAVRDTSGIQFESEGEVRYRVLFDGINEIADIQLTADEGDGDSPFVGLTLPMNIEAVVQSRLDVSGFLSVQDDSTLGPWSGLILEPTDAINGMELQPGDNILIAGGTVEEIRGIRFDRSGDLTGLSNPTVSRTTGSGTPFAYKELTTDAVDDESVAEAHEGMLVRFNNVVITNPDEGFGEWSFATRNGDGTNQAPALADDASDALSSSFATSMWAGGEAVDFIQGIWGNSFGNAKLFPEDSTDVGVVTNVATEDADVPSRFVLDQNYPNPFNPQTTIRYEVGAVGQVTLEVFDVLGRRVATLVDGQQTPGAYTVTFDAANLPSGLYLYRLEAGSKVHTKKMMLLK